MESPGESAEERPIEFDHERAKAARASIANIGLAALRELAAELRGYGDEREKVPVEWFAKYKIAADQLRRDFPDRLLQPPCEAVEHTEDDPLAGMILTLPRAS